MTESNSERDRLWGQLAVAWQLVDADDLQRLQAESTRNPATSTEYLLRHQANLSDDDRKALDWMVQRLSQSGQSAGMEAFMSTLHSPATPPPAEDPKFESTLDQATHQDPAANVDATLFRSKYTRQHLHATGGIGQVWVARDEAIERDVAMKKLRPDRAGNAETRARFLFEAQVTGQLEHPGVVPVYELDPTESSPSYTMRFFRGHTFKEAIDDYHQRRLAQAVEPLEFVQLLNALVSICNTVEYAHSRSVVHRDLKGQNVVLGDFGEVIVLDWGLAKRHDRPEAAMSATETPISAESSSDTMMGAIVGTPAYMAPEQACGQSERVGPGSDVYALGVMLYQVLTGQVPFEADTRDKLLRMVIHDAPPAPRSLVSSVPASLEAICLKALEKQPEDRYGSARELADDVQRFLADEPVTACLEPVLARCARWGRRHRTLVTTAAGVLVMAVVALATGTGLLADANRRIDTQRTIAENNGERAERNFRRALGAVNDYLSNVSQNKLLDVPGMHALRRELLEDALQYYAEFAKEDGGDPAIRVELADAHYRIGRIHTLLGSIDDARASLTTALAISAEVEHETPGAIPPLQRSRYLAEFGKLEEVTGNHQAAMSYYNRAIQTLDDHLQHNPTDEAAKLDLAANYVTVSHVQFRTQNIQEARTFVDLAIDHFRQLADAQPTVVQLQISLSDALALRGILERETGDPVAALATFDDPILRLEALLDEHGNKRDLRTTLSMCYHSRAILLRYMNRIEDAKASFESAISVRQTVVRDFPSVPDSWSELATSYNSLGILYWQTDDLDNALRCYDLALEQQQRLVSDHPAIPLHRGDLGDNFNNVAIIHRQRGEYDEAIAAYHEVIRIRKQLLTEVPESVRNQTALGNAYRNLGRVYDAQGDFQEMVEWCDRAIEILAPLHQRIGDDPRVQNHLQRAHWDRAEALLELDRPAEAAAAWDAAWELDNGRDRNFIKMQRARALALAGDHVQATAEAERLSNSELDGETTYDGARVFSQAVSALKDDANLADAQRESLADGYTNRAVKLLLLAGERGYFADPENREALSSDVNFDAIRDHKAFVELLKNLLPTPQPPIKRDAKP